MAKTAELILTIASNDTDWHITNKSMSNYRFLYLVLTYYSSGPIPIYGNLMIPTAIIPYCTEQVTLFNDAAKDFMNVNFSYGVNGIMVSIWSSGGNYLLVYGIN